MINVHINFSRRNYSSGCLSNCTSSLQESSSLFAFFPQSSLVLDIDVNVKLDLIRCFTGRTSVQG